MQLIRLMVKFSLIDLLLSQKGFKLQKWNFQGWVYRLKYVLGRYFEVPTSNPSPSRGPWTLMTFKNMFVIKVKPCKIDLLLNWSTTKLFSASKLCSVPFYKVLKICGKILVNDFLIFWKEFRLGKWNFQG